MKRLLLALTTMASLFIVTLAPVAAAYNPLGGVCSTDTRGSAVCSTPAPTGSPIYGSNGVIAKIANIIGIVAGAAAVIVLLIASIKYLVSQGDSNAVNSAKQTIIYALLGIVVIVLARSLIVYVVSRIT